MPKKESIASKSKPATAAPKRARATSAKTPAPVASLTDEQIRLRAYELYLRRNAAPGDPVADWLRAERELAAELTSPGRA